MRIETIKAKIKLISLNIVLPLSVCASPLFPTYAAASVTSINGSPRNISSNGQIVVGSTQAFSPGFDHAFRLFSDNFEDLGTLGGNTSVANATTDTGAVVGQAQDAGGNLFAFFRSANGSMISLGTLPGDNLSAANSLRNNGNQIVGDSTSFINGRRAILTTLQAGPMIDLGALAGDTNSTANDISEGNGIIVGTSFAPVGVVPTKRAVKWTTPNPPPDNISAVGGIDRESEANAINSDGTVITGQVDFTNLGNFNAFRWTQATGIVSIQGSLPGTSIGNDVSNDGNVIVGNYTNGAQRGFRWTQTTGLLTVEDWLRANGVQVASDFTLTATSVSGDGNIVVGDTNTGQGYIARVSSSNSSNNSSNQANGGNGGGDGGDSGTFGSGLITFNQLFESLASVASVPNVAFAMNELILHGSHSHPLSSRIVEDNYGFWIAGDWAEGRHHLRAKVAEVNAGYVFNDCLQTNLSLGNTRSKQNLILNSNVSLHGNYVMLEALGRVTQNLWATLTGFYHVGHLKLRRGYYNAGFLDVSFGRTRAKSPGGRFRLDWENIFNLGKICITPFGEISYVRTKIKKFTERRGGFPARFYSLRGETPEARIGLNGVIPFERFNLIAGLQGVQLLEREGTNVGGQLLGLFNFAFPGERLKRNWLQASLGIEGCIASGRGSLYLNGATKGLAPSAWLAATYYFN